MIDVFLEQHMRRPPTYPISQHGPIAFDVDVNYVNPYSRTTYANDVKFSNFEAGTAAIL